MRPSYLSSANAGSAWVVNRKGGSAGRHRGRQRVGVLAPPLCAPGAMSARIQRQPKQVVRPLGRASEYPPRCLGPMDPRTECVPHSPHHRAVSRAGNTGHVPVRTAPKDGDATKGFPLRDSPLAGFDGPRSDAITVVLARATMPTVDVLRARSGASLISTSWACPSVCSVGVVWLRGRASRSLASHMSLVVLVEADRQLKDWIQGGAG